MITQGRRHEARRRPGLGVVASAAAIVAATLFAAPVAPAVGAPVLSVSVQGNTLVDGSGSHIRLLGVNRSGAEYACAQGWGIFDGPTDAASIAAMKSWHINTVRVPLNEDCWLGINGVNAPYGGANYRSAIGSYVTALHNAGLLVILDLHWNAPGATLATGQQVMTDADHSPAFWTSVATYFKTDPAVIFDLYNEPHDIPWPCWRDGCTTSGGWQAAGMQSLVDAVRSTGATQPVLLGGLGWSSDLSQWLTYKPTDPANQTAASFHVYNFSGCSTSACWASAVGPVAASVPVVTGEIGENDCVTAFIAAYMAWADTNGVSYLGWTWNTWDCSSGPALISAYDGTPTSFGIGFRDHLAALARRAPADFDGDGASDVAVFRPSTNTWFVRRGATVVFGTSGDIPVPGDYDGNRSADMAVFRPSTGTWFVRGGATVVFGTSGDIPAPGDYDGNGTTDFAVFRPSTGTWYVQGGATVAFGTSGDIPVPGDYDGNGTTDLAVFRPSTGTWFIRGGATTAWGSSGDIPVPGDYDGNGTTDLAVFRPTTAWFVRGGSTVGWGTNGDVPAPGHYDSNGSTDIAVFRPSTGTWFVRGGATVGWGTTGDIALALPAAIRLVAFP